MNKIWLSSDLHLLHDKSFMYEPRGFSSIEEHDEAIINTWNNIVSQDDIVINLGDFYMTADHEKGCKLINKLNGHIILIRGNHDSDNKINAILEKCSNVDVMGWAMPFKYQGYNFYLSHYPCLVSNCDADKPLKQRTIALAGHSHSQDRWKDWDKGLIYHVEWDAHGAPKLLDEIIEEIKEKIDG